MFKEILIITIKLIKNFYPVLIIIPIYFFIRSLNYLTKIENKSDYFRKRIKKNNKRVKKALKLFNCDKNASWHEIKIKYKKLIKEYHPDFKENLENSEKKRFEEKSKDLNESFNILKKYYKRKRGDEIEK